MSGRRPVTEGASLACSFGAAPSTLATPPDRALRLGNRRLALVSDHTPDSVPPFGMCSAPGNPQVAAATAAAGGALTPQPCAPALDGPWQPGGHAVRAGQRAPLDEGCTCACRWGGVVSVVAPGAVGARVG